MARQTKIAILLLGIALLASACSARKKMVQPLPPQSFEWLTAKLDLQADANGKSFDDLAGQLRMRKDSLVWLSVTATMGVEVLRAKVSNDSAWIVSRLEKTYLAEPLDTLAFLLGMPLSLPWLQNLLLDNNEGLAPVENQTVQLKSFAYGGYSVKVKYSNVKREEKTTFPLKITDKMERLRLPTKR